MHRSQPDNYDIGDFNIKCAIALTSCTILLEGGKRLLYRKFTNIFFNAATVACSYLASVGAKLPMVKHIVMISISVSC